MIKSTLVAAVLVASFAATASAQDRTISYWGHDYEVGAAQPRTGVFALAAPDATRIQAPVATHHRRRQAR